MIGSVSASRRAHAFAETLDEPDHGLGEEAADGDHEQAQLLALADGLAALPRPALEPEVKTVQRAQLVAAMESAVAAGLVGDGDGDGSVPGQRPGGRGKGAHRAPVLGGLRRFRPASRLGKGIAAGGLSVGVAATAFGGAAAASTDALPGDTLYGLKLGMEDLRLDMAGDDADRGRVHLDHASTRLREARRLLERDRAGALDHESVGEVRHALSGMKHEASEGHRLLSRAYARHGGIGVMQSLSSFSEGNRARWAELRDRLPGQLSEVGDEVSSVFAAMEQEVGPLRELFPEEPHVPGAADGPGGDGRHREGGATIGPSPASPDGSPGEGRDGRETPDPSGSEPVNDGILGEDGLLRPPVDPHDGRSGSATGPDGDARPEPDITLPPLVPDVLPGLGSDRDKE